jgi:hypothetical protein
MTEILPTPELASQVHLIWWHIAFTHVKLAVRGTVWNCHEGSYRLHGCLDSVRQHAKTNAQGRGIVLCALPMSADNQNALEAFLLGEQQKISPSHCLRHTCIGGVSRALAHAQGGFRLWPIFPCLVVLYLVCRRLVHPQGREIEYVGPASLLRNLVSLQVAFEILGTLTLLTLIAEAIYFGVTH